MKKLLSGVISMGFTAALIISCSSAPKTADVASPAPSAQTKIDPAHPEERPSDVVVSQNEPVRNPNLGASSSGYAH